MGYNITTKDLIRNRISPEYYLERFRLKSFRYKKTGERVEEKIEVYEEHHPDTTSNVNVYDKNTGAQLGYAKITNPGYTELKERKKIFHHEEYARITPFTDNKLVKKLDKMCNFISLIREILFYVILVVAVLLVMFYVNSYSPNVNPLEVESDFSSWHNFAMKLVIFYIILVMATIIICGIAKKQLQKCNYLLRTKKHFVDRITRLEQDYRNNQIGYDAYRAKRKELEQWLSYL